MTNLKLWLYGGLAVLLFGLILRYDYLSEKVESQKVELAQKTEQLNAINETLELEREALRVATENRAKYYLQLESAENEIKTLRARVDSGAAKLRVKATCPKLPTSVTDTTGTIATSPELTEDARQDYYAHRADENKLNSLLDLCVQSMINDRASLKQDKQ